MMWPFHGALSPFTHPPALVAQRGGGARSPTGVALSVTSGGGNSLVGVAIAASLLPPVVNTGVCLAFAAVVAVWPSHFHAAHFHSVRASPRRRRRRCSLFPLPHQTRSAPVVLG